MTRFTPRQPGSAKTVLDVTAGRPETRPAGHQAMERLDARTLLVSAAVIGALLPSGTGIVLCYGADGHVELEIGRSGACGTQPACHEEGLEHAVACDACCGSCVDITIAADAVDALPRPASPPVAPAAVVVERSALYAAPSARALRPRGPVPFELPHLRSTVLRL